MTITIYSNEAQLTSPLFARAMQKGCGGNIVHGNEDPVGAWAGFGDPLSWPSLTKAIRTGMDWYYGDHSYFHHGRKVYYRITKNAFQHRGVGKPDYERLAPFFSRAEKFKKHGRYILICLQSENYHARMGSPLPQYLDNLVARIRLYSDREIVVRTKLSESKFHHDLTGAWAVVAHSSATAIEALMHGVPAFTTSDNAAGLLTLRDPINIERPYFPSADERMHMAAVLARQQWTLEEISTGLAWRTLHENF
jgi:hypothetical protein